MKKQEGHEGSWFEIVSYFDHDSGSEIGVGGESIKTSGEIDEVIVVQVPHDMDDDEAHQMMSNVQATLEASGIDKPLILVPDIVHFMKLKKLGPDEALALNVNYAKKAN